MKAVRIHEYGDPMVLKYEDMARPSPGADEVLVRVHATSVNPVDQAIRGGYLQKMIPVELPLTLGLDVAGVIEMVGEGVTAFAVGDEVYGYANLARQGAYAEYAVLKTSELARKPKTIDFTAAAAVPLAGLTAWQSLFDFAGLRTGPTALIHGGGGGVGSFAIQFAAAKGARVIATASRDKVEFLRKLGAADVIDYAAARFEDVVHGADAALDYVGGEVSARSLSTLKAGGILVTTAGQPDAAAAEARGLRATGMMTQANSSQLAEIASLIDSGRVKPEVSLVLPLSEASKAHERIAQGHMRGKIILKVIG